MLVILVLLAQAVVVHPTAAPPPGDPMLADTPQKVAARRMPPKSDRTASSRWPRSTSYKVMMPADDMPKPKAQSPTLTHRKPRP